jgi:ribonuclease HII
VALDGGETLGIDEAGRGAQVGPLVLAGVVLGPGQAQHLLAVGLGDSKPLSAGRRHELAIAIRASAAWVDVEVSPAQLVDRYVAGRGTRRTSLNVLEQRMARALIRRAPAAALIVADGRTLFRPLERRTQNFRAVDHADETEPPVMAAAIVAKVERDRLLAQIENACASLCGFIPRRGYPGVETTAWLARYERFFGQLPPEARLTWGRRGYVNRSKHEVL